MIESSKYKDNTKEVRDFMNNEFNREKFKEFI